MKPYRSLFFICLAALLMRVACLAFVQHPGIGDPNHYYNLALRLLDGHGFTIDYIWQFYNPPQSIVHPDDFWMPLTGVLAAISMKMFGVSTIGALLAFVSLGSLLPITGYIAARQFGCNEITSLFAAAAVAALPEFMLNSVRTDTTLPNTILVVVCILMLTNGLQTGRVWSFIGSGVAAGLAYLTRGDNLLLLPMLVVTVVVYALWGDKTASRKRYGYTAIIPVIALAVASPWLIHNLQVNGSLLASVTVEVEDRLTS